MQYEIHSKYIYLEKEILAVPQRFDKEGKQIYQGRNVLKVLDVGGIPMCIKSFKHPILINKIAYAYFRKSKAERSFLYANRLIELGIGTPEPVAFILYTDNIGLTKSFYISLQIDPAITIRGIKELPKKEQLFVYTRFASFTHNFHQKGVWFTDHSPGNTLISKGNTGEYCFWLIDLNRTQFKKAPIPYKKGLQNLSMLELPDADLQIIASEYASLSHKDEKDAVRRLIGLTQKHNKHVGRKSFIRNTRRAIKRWLCPKDA